MNSICRLAQSFISASGVSSRFFLSASNHWGRRHAFATDAPNSNLFEQFGKDWWNESGSLKALHSMNEIRIPWIVKSIAGGLEWDYSGCNGKDSVRIVDVGCGGGILTEPLCRLGASVVGLDESTDAISIAREHAERLKEDFSDRLTYVNSKIENYKGSEQFDAVVASEIIEHVDDRLAFVESCSKLVKKGGLIFVTTLNQTLLSKIFGIWVAENVLNIVPKGVHEWEKFISPSDLQKMFESVGCRVRMVSGMGYDPLFNRWFWCPFTQINYAMLAVKV